MSNISSVETIEVSDMGVTHTPKSQRHLVVSAQSIEQTMIRYGYSDLVCHTIAQENLLPPGLLSRLHASYP